MKKKIGNVIFVVGLLSIVVSIPYLIYKGLARIVSFFSEPEVTVDSLGIKSKVSKEGTLILSDDQRKVMSQNLNREMKLMGQMGIEALAAQASLFPQSLQKTYPNSIRKFILDYTLSNNKEKKLLDIVSPERRKDMMDQMVSQINFDEVLMSQPFRTWLSNHIKENNFSYDSWEKLNVGE